MSNISSLSSLRLEKPPDCIEFCSIYPDYAVIGTYELIERGPEQTKQGSLVLIYVNGDNINVVQTLAQDVALTDVHFNPFFQHIICASTSDARLLFYDIRSSTDKEHPTIHYLGNINLEPGDSKTVFEAFQWHPKLPGILAITASNGFTFLCHVDVSKLLSRIKQTDTMDFCLDWRAIGDCGLEGLTVAWTPSGTTLFSGDDGQCLRAYRCEFKISTNTGELEEIGEVTLDQVWQNKKIHQAGVTAVLSLSDRTIITGSYDDHLRVITPFENPRVRLEHNLGGGVWRLKLFEEPTPGWETSKEDIEFQVLASCNFAGTRILKITRRADGDWKIDILAKFTEHGSMNYGSDFKPNNTESRKKTIISTSFYDRLICLWRANIE